MDIYICPMCKQENAEHQSYCLNCGKWLVNAKKKEKKKRFNPSVIIIAVIAIVGVIWYLNGNVLPGEKLVFDPITVGDLTVSQLEVTSGVKSSIQADITANKDITKMIEISTVFYDQNNNRLGKAKTLLTHQLSANQTTTIDLIFDTPTDIKNARSVRVEVRPF